MKIAVVAPTAVPYVFGGAERLHRGLTDALVGQGHDAELIEVPSREASFSEIVDSYAAFSSLDVSGFDLVITGKYPAWMIDHPNHVVYMLHALRGLYDTYHVFSQPFEEKYDDAALSAFRGWLDQGLTREELPELIDRCKSLIEDLGEDHPALRFPGPLSRALVHTMDSIGLSRRSVKRWFSISNTVACRREYFPDGVPVQVLHPPSDLLGLRPRRFDYLFTSSRLDSPKRLDLLIEAMRYVGTDVRLKIAGTGPLLDELKEMASSDDRIEFLGHVSTEDLVALYSDALAVPFVPYDEDLGLVAWEAMMSGKAVITCHDSGGPCELVESSVTGIVTGPTPGQIGRVIERLCADPQEAVAMGERGRMRAQGMTWTRVVRGLIPRSNHVSKPLPARPARRKVVVLSTYPIWPPRAGGQLRCAHLYSSLARSMDVQVVCLSTAGPEVDRSWPKDGIEQISVRKSLQHRRTEVTMSDEAGIPVEDIMASRLIDSTPSFREILNDCLRDASAVLHAHPYLVPMASDVQVPIIYDAIDVEYLLKGSILSQGPSADIFREAVEKLEAAAWRKARLVVAASQQDMEALASRYGQSPSSKIVVPNGVDVRRVPFTGWNARHRRRDRWLARVGSSRDRIATFIGSWHPPNLDAADHIRDMAGGLPLVEFLLAGGHSEHYRDKWLPSNVHLLGSISDAAKLSVLGMADIGLNPMTRGSGTNLKVIEYFAAGLPVLTTPKGIRGIQASPGEQVMVADLDNFGDGIDAMFEQDQRTELMAVAARRLAERFYDWESLGRRFSDAVAEAINDP